MFMPERTLFLASLQKLYKFINCVELVSPHHSAKELANSLRTGQIMGLFQKSVKRVRFRPIPLLVFSSGQIAVTINQIAQNLTILLIV